MGWGTQSASGYDFQVAHWIWTGAEDGYNDYREALHEFEWTATQRAEARTVRLHITADALYQVWINGKMLGHGPAKSAAGTRSVDRYDITNLVQQGTNRLEAVVLNIGVGTMTYCHGLPGLLFEISDGDKVLAASGAGTLMRQDQQRNSQTVRRWILPCLEDVDASALQDNWQPADIVERSQSLYDRRVPLPSRQTLPVKRIIDTDRVKFPTFSISFRHKPYLVPVEQILRQNTYDTPAYIVTDILSPADQALEFTPTRGAVDWYFDRRLVISGSGWYPWQTVGAPRPTIQLHTGSNRLIGIRKNDHFTEMNLAGYTDQPVTFKNPFGKGGFQVVRMEPDKIARDQALLDINLDELRTNMPVMDPEHTLFQANAQDLAVGATLESMNDIQRIGVLDTSLTGPITLPPAPAGHAVRVIVDLGAVHNGYLAFDVNGHARSRLILSMIEGRLPAPPEQLQWTYGCENALTYHLKTGLQHFESFHPYGVRYIAIHHTGDEPVELSNLRILTANCGSRNQGYLKCSDPLLNEIYDLAVQTLVSGTDDTFTDCPTYEQVNWNFDNRAAFLGDSLTCANNAVTKNSILLFAEDPDYAGLVRSQYPSTWDNQIPLWSLHWIMWCNDYFQATGDTAFIEKVFPRIQAGITEALGKIDNDGLMHWSDVWHFVEWAHGRDDNHDVCAAEQAGLAGALNAAIILAEVLEQDVGADWQDARDQLVEAINRQLWNAEKQAYVDSLHNDGAPSSVSSQATNAMMCIYGVADEERARTIIKSILENEPSLLPCGSPYGLYYVLELYDQFNMVEPIFDTIRHRWGDMVRAGDKTAWEHFAEYGHMGFPTRSRCHPFAAYVIKYLNKYLLGIQNQTPGYGSVRVDPMPPENVDFCHGAIPTPQGLIQVDWQKVDDTLDIQTNFPDNE